MNRITRILHKSFFKKRQRQAVAYSHNYVIKADDKLGGASVQVGADQMTEAQKIEVMLDGFEPETDSVDRRLLFEITGYQLREGEFADEGTSDENWERVLAPDPQFYAFNYQEESDEEEDTGQDGTTEKTEGSKRAIN